MGKHDKDKDRKRVKQSQKEAKAADKAGDRGGHHAAKAHGLPARVDDSCRRAATSSWPSMARLGDVGRRPRTTAPRTTPPSTRSAGSRSGSPTSSGR